MLFNSFEFLLFFPIVTIGYFLLPHRYRALFLLLASCLFYMAFIPVYILILLFLIVFDYYAGRCIEGARGAVGRKSFLIASLCANLGILAVFKYCNFFIDNANVILGLLGWEGALRPLSIILPIGLSFHTFQAMSYTIEVYRGTQKAERNIIIYALYVMFYPQLVAGPIERPQHLLYQFRVQQVFEYKRAADGIKLMVWGLFKKVVIADRLAMAVNHVYAMPGDHNGVQLAIGTVFFAFQIYCDFSGYSDIAIGAAQVMGFNLMDNFNRPYFSKSTAEFWKRWHISLSTWFRDYLYIPLGGSRTGRRRWGWNILVTFILSGLWHGAQWTYIVWGALNGFYVLCSHWKTSQKERWLRMRGIRKMPFWYPSLQVGLTFCLICFAWIFFRAKNLSDALCVISRLPTGWGCLFDQAHLRAGLAGIGMSGAQFLIAASSIGLLLLVHRIQRHGSIRDMLSERPAWLRWTVYYAMVLSILFFGIFNDTQFIYFQF